MVVVAVVVIVAWCNASSAVYCGVVAVAVALVAVVVVQFHWCSAMLLTV